MAFSSGGSGGLRGDINVTPLVDVVLVLLIIFMVVTPMLQRGKDVDLPKARAVSKEKESDPLVLSITPDHAVWLESERVTIASLEQKLGGELEKSRSRRILLKADASLSVRDVRQLMQVTRQAGAAGVELALEELKKP
jgi:biopolymer transport protein TolR